MEKLEKRGLFNIGVNGQILNWRGQNATLGQIEKALGLLSLIKQAHLPGETSN